MDQEQPENHAVLHSVKQRKSSNDHVEVLKQRGQNAYKILCSDISRLESTSMSELSSLHLIVDSCMYHILMSDGRLHDIAHRKFRELDESDKKIYVLNTFQTEFDDLYHRLPENVKHLWPTTGQINEGSSQQQHDHRLPNIAKLDVTGVTGGTVETAYAVGNVDGGMGNKLGGDGTNNMTGVSRDSSTTGTITGGQFNMYGPVTMNMYNRESYALSGVAIERKDSSSERVEQGPQPDSHNQVNVKINNAEHNQEIIDKVIDNKDKLTTKHPISEVEAESGCVLIKLTVDRHHIMTDEWIQEILKTIFHDILKDFLGGGKTFEVTVDRHVSIGLEELLKMYSSYHSQDDHTNKCKKWLTDSPHSFSKESGIGMLTTDDDDDYNDCDDDDEDEGFVGLHPYVKTPENAFRFLDRSCKGCLKCETIDELNVLKTNYLVMHVNATSLLWRYRHTTASRDTRLACRKEREQLLLKFSRLISAARNTGGGVVLLHIEGLKRTDRSLNQVYEYIVTRLNRMLEQASLYSNIYKIESLENFLQDEKGKPLEVLYSDIVCVRAVPSESVTTVKFNTTVSNDVECLNMNREQAIRYLKMRTYFINTVPRVLGLQHFREGVNVHCKRVFEETLIVKEPGPFVDYIWTDLKLRLYISAFTKVESGGSYYLGIDKTDDAYAIEGFQYDSNNLNSLRHSLRRRIESETIVLYFDSETIPAPLSQEYVEIVFHNVSPNRFVCEVAVAAVNGLVFHTKHGPDSYELTGDNKLHRLSLLEWQRRLLMGN